MGGSPVVVPGDALTQALLASVAVLALKLKQVSLLAVLVVALNCWPSAGSGDAATASSNRCCSGFLGLCFAGLFFGDAGRN